MLIKEDERNPEIPEEIEEEREPVETQDVSKEDEVQEQPKENIERIRERYGQAVQSYVNTYGREPSVTQKKHTLAYLSDRVDTDTPELEDFFNAPDSKEANQALADIENKNFSFGKLVGSLFGLGNEKRHEKSIKIKQSLKEDAVMKLNRIGIPAYYNPETQQMMLDTGDDKMDDIEINPSFWNAVKAGKFEILGSLLGTALVGGALGAAPLTGGASVIALFAGGALGAGLGSAQDALDYSMKFDETLSKQEYAQEMIDGAIGDVVSTIVGGAVVKVASPVVKAGARVVTAPFRKVAGFFKGNPKAATRLLQEKQFRVLPDKDLLENFQTVVDDTSQQKLGFSTKKHNNGDYVLTADNLTEKQKTTLVLHNYLHTAEGVDFVKGVKSMGYIMREESLKQVDELTNKLQGHLGEAGKEVRPFAVLSETFANLSKANKRMFGNMRDLMETVNGNELKFKKFVDVGNTNTIQDVTMADDLRMFNSKFIDKFNDIVQNGDTLDLTQSLDMLQLINRVKNSVSTKEYARFQEGLGRMNVRKEKIAAAIRKGLYDNLDTKKAGEIWDTIQETRNFYGKIENTIKNVKAKVTKITKDTANEQDIMKGIESLFEIEGESLGTFLSLFPQETRATIESLYLKRVFDKHAKTASNQNVLGYNYNAIANQLNSISFTSTYGKQMKDMVQAFSPVFQNHQLIEEVIGIKKGAPKSFLASNLAQRSIFYINSTLWNTLSHLLPTETGRAYALLGMLHKIVDKKITAKTVESFVQETPKPLQKFTTDSFHNLVRHIEELRAGQQEMLKTSGIRVNQYAIISERSGKQLFQTKNLKGLIRKHPYLKLFLGKLGVRAIKMDNGSILDIQDEKKTGLEVVELGDASYNP